LIDCQERSGHAARAHRELSACHAEAPMIVLHHLPKPLLGIDGSSRGRNRNELSIRRRMKIQRRNEIRLPSRFAIGGHDAQGTTSAWRFVIGTVRLGNYCVCLKSSTTRATQSRTH
jgi:hypothetical protein